MTDIPQWGPQQVQQYDGWSCSTQVRRWPDGTDERLSYVQATRQGMCLDPTCRWGAERVTQTGTVRRYFRDASDAVEWLDELRADADPH